MMKNDKKLYEVTVQVITEIEIPVFASSEEDAQDKVSDDVFDNEKEFKRHNADMFVYSSYFDDYRYWKTREIKEDDESYEDISEYAL